MIYLIIGELVLEGVVLAALWLFLTRRVAQRNRIIANAVLLVVAAAIYICFAINAGDHTGLYIEIAGTTLFGVLAAIGLRRRSLATIAAGWAVHPLWDVGLHFGVFPDTGGPGTYATIGYVVACFGFDWFLAAALVRHYRREIRLQGTAHAISAGNF